MPKAQVSLSSLLVNGVHRFATCWIFERTDGTILRFTNHNTVLTVDGYQYTPIGSPSASAVEKKDGVEGNNFVARSYIDSTSLTYEDLVAGKYRDCSVTEFLVDWKYPWLGKFRVSICRILETTINKEVWEASVEDLKSRMKQRVGRIYSRNCDYVFGDPDTCGVDLSLLSDSGSVNVATSNRLFTVSGLVSQPDGYFDDGTIEWTSGANNGLKSEIKSHISTSIELHVKTAFDVAPGDTFDITPGCKHTKEACKSFQGNLLRFGGFPTVPGNDKLLSTPDAH